MDQITNPGSLPAQLERLQAEYAHLPGTPLSPDDWSLRDHVVNMRLRLDRCGRFMMNGAPAVLVLNDIRLMRDRLDKMEAAVRLATGLAVEVLAAPGEGEAGGG